MTASTSPDGSTMISRPRPYPVYKDSGVEWLGEIPAHWEVRRLKYCVGVINQRASDVDKQTNHYIGLENIESWTGRILPGENDIEVEGEANLFAEDDVLFGKLRPYLAKAFLAHMNGSCSSELIVMRPRELLPRYLMYRLLSVDFIREVDSSTYGTKMPRANWGFIGNLPMLAPPLPEQRAIAGFLDRETARIDTLTAKKEQLIALLQEKRAALITHAVTRGLDPHAPLKESGVEWIGRLPAHWDLVQLRRVTEKFVDYRGATPEKVASGIPLITARNVKNGRIDFSLSEEFIAEDAYESWMVRGLPEIGDVLVTTEAPLGESAQIEDPEIALAQRIILLKSRKENITNDYLKYYFTADSGRGELWTKATGSTAVGIKASHLKEILVSVPAVDQQEQITPYLDRETAKIDTLIATVQTGIVRLKEYRSALIAAAVTGKIDVREEP